MGKIMNERRESEFAYILGYLAGMLSDEEIIKYLKDKGIEGIVIDTVLQFLKEIAAKAFYK